MIEIIEADKSAALIAPSLPIVTVPIGTVTIGKDGAINAALLSASIISINDKNVRRNLNLWRNKQTRSVKKKPS